MDIARSELKAWARKSMRGLENCILPSFTPDLSGLDEEGIRWDVQKSIQSGYFSTLCSAEIGLTHDEAKRFISIVADEARDKLLVSTTVFGNSFGENIDLLQHAAKAGCHNALLGYPPNFYPQTEEDIYKATREMCATADLGVVLYTTHKVNFERFHPSGFPPSLLERLADIDNVTAMKVGSADFGYIYECFERVGDRVLVSCPMLNCAPFFVKKYGMQWIGAAVYEMFQSPEKPFAVEFFDHLLAGREQEAMELYWFLTPVLKVFEQYMMAIMMGTYHWNMLKYHQWCVGLNGGFTRPPVLKMFAGQMQMVKMAYRMVGIEPREPDEEFYEGRLNYCRSRGLDPTQASAPAFPFPGPPPMKGGAPR